MRTSLFVLFAFLASSCGSEQVVVRETEASCGDGIVGTGEECDDGNDDTSDGCTSFCTIAACGDGVLRADLEPGDEGYEACDDANTVDDDRCTANCLEAACGDGILRADLSEGDQGYETCDDGNLRNDDACLDSCRPAGCGDGFEGSALAG